MTKHCASVSRMILLLLGSVAAAPPVTGAVIIATGQNNGDPSHNSGNYFYSIDVTTGLATPISPQIAGGTPAGLAGAPDGRLLGFFNGSVVEVNPVAGTWTNVAPAEPINVTGFDATHTGGAYGVPFAGGERRLHRLDLATNAATPTGPAGAVGFALDSFFGDAPGTNEPFIISLGSVARRQNIGTTSNPNVVTVSTLYGVNLSTGRNQLMAINPDTGVASVVGAINSVATSGAPGAGAYSGFAALTGVDLDADGLFDSLFGNANFFDPDGSGPLPSERFGGVVRYDLADGTWDLVGSNPGLIFFGMGSLPTPEPGSATLAMAGLSGFLARRRRPRPGRADRLLDAELRCLASRSLADPRGGGLPTV